MASDHVTNPFLSCDLL